MSHFTRRTAIKGLGLAATALTVPGIGCASRRPAANDDFLVQHGPINRSAPVGRFSGDDPDRAHALLRDGPRDFGEFVAPIRDGAIHKVVVVGGGMSGLLSAYLLRDLNPVLLERGLRFGGNSQGETWQGLAYSIGAAYFMNPPKGSKTHELLEEVGVLSRCRPRRETGSVLAKGLNWSIWTGATDSTAVRQFQRARDFFLDRARGRAPMPNVPAYDENDLRVTREMDRESFQTLLERELEESLHPHLRALVNLYCWSTFCASPNELSASLGLNYFSSEFDEVMVAPGGNAGISECFLRALTADLPRSCLRPGSTVVKVRDLKDHVEVIYIDHTGATWSLRAQALVMAAPKFIAKRIMDGMLDTDRLEALSRLEYRAYIVANAGLAAEPRHDLHDLFLLQEGNKGTPDSRATDLIFANFAQREAGRTVLSLYCPLPSPTGRTAIVRPEAFDDLKTKIRRQIESDILPALGYNPGDLKELRLARWGHPLPLARPGFYAKGTPKAISRPQGDRIFFVNQDNWAAPSFETCSHEALHWTPRIRAVVS